MMGRKLWYIVTLLAFALLPLAGCSGGGSSPAKATEKGTQLTVSGNVNDAAAKSTAKTTALTAITEKTVEVYNAQDGATLGTATIATNGSFSGLTFTLPATKTVLVFKATFNAGTYLNIVPIDLSNPPAAGAITGNNPINIVISQESTAIAKLVSSFLGLTGDLGDAGMTLNSVSKTYADAAQQVVNNGGQQLAYGGSGLALSGKLSIAGMLPALDANNLAADQLNNMTLDGSITTVAIPGSKPVVSFQVINKATGKGIRGLKAFNLVIAQLKPASNGSPSEWLSYMVNGTTSAPSTDSGYTVIDNGDGSYTVVFGKDIKTGTGGTVGYDGNLTHRVMVGIRSTPSFAPLQDGTTLSNFYNEKYFISTFVPATPGVAPTEQRDMTTTEACNECHGKIGVTTPHGGRGDVKYCMMCHTAQRANGQAASTEAGGVFTGPIYSVSPTNSRYDANQAGKPTTFVVDGIAQGDFGVMIHKIHMGNKLTKKGYNYAGVFFNDITYPKGIDNCRQCHRGDTPAELALAPQANNWKEKPSRKSCGSCHDNINFATGVNSASGVAGHMTGNHPPQADDSFCVGCHGTSGPYKVEDFHMSENATPNNPFVRTGLVNFFYEVNSVNVVEAGTPTTSTATIKFRIQQNTGSLTATKSNVVFTGAGSSASTVPANAVLNGFSGSPAFLLAYYKDAVNQPTANYAADYNNLGVKAAQPITVSIATLLNGAKGTLAGPDASGFYTATLAGAANNFPVGAKLRAVGLQAYFTQVAGTNGITADTARHALSSVKSVTGDAKRRDVVDSAKCGNCHEWFEGHGGNRIVGKDTVGDSICTLCHVPNLTTSGRGAQASLIDWIIAQPVNTSLGSVTDFLKGTAFSGTVSQGAKDAMTALVASLGNDPTLYPETSNNFKDMVHGIHAGSNPLVVGTPLKFVRDRGTSGDFDYNFSGVTFPGVLKNCTMCHKGTTYTTIPVGAQVSTQVTTTGIALVKQTGTPASLANGNNVTQVDLDRKSLPNAQDLVSSPFAATCKACHNRPSALAHFSQMGGKISQPRSTVNPNDESCVTCHGTTGPNALFNVHRFSVVAD